VFSAVCGRERGRGKESLDVPLGKPGGTAAVPGDCYFRPEEHPDEETMHARIVIPLAALAAIALAFALPGPHRLKAHPVPQVQTIKVGY